MMENLEIKNNQEEVFSKQLDLANDGDIEQKDVIESESSALREKLILPILEYRQNQSFEEMIFEIVLYIKECGNLTDDEIESLKECLLSNRALFSTPILLSLGNKKHEGKPRTGSCYIVNVDDMSIEEILKLHNDIFDGGGGVGSNLSSQRDINTLLFKIEENARKRHSGIVGRGCSIAAIVDSDAHNFEDFLSSSFGGEQYRHILKNVMISPGFMEKAKILESSEYSQLRMIARSMIDFGTPGILFKDHINKDQPYEIRATNPCAEFLCADNTSANLSAINLEQFYDNGVIDFDALRKVAMILTKAQNAILENSDYPTSEIEEQTKKLRPIGVGVTNLGGLLAKLKFSYDSRDARELAATIAKEVNSAVKSVDSNTQTTLIAPTGRIGRIMQCKHFGIESDLKDQTSELDMLESVQPHISGGISNTIEYNYNITEEELVKDIQKAHEKGLKSFIAFVNKFETTNIW